MVQCINIWYEIVLQLDHEALVVVMLLFRDKQAKIGLKVTKSDQIAYRHSICINLRCQWLDKPDIWGLRGFGYWWKDLPTQLLSCFRDWKYWWQMVIQIINFQENRHSLIVVRLDDFQESRLNKELQYILKTLTYLSWPKNESEENTFWQKLKLTLMKKSSSYTNSNMSLIECWLTFSNNPKR